MADDDGLIAGYILDQKGGGRKIEWPQVEQWKAEDGILWVHFDYSALKAQQWLMEKSGLDPIVAEALLTEETRPRITSMDDGLLVALRGVNLNPEADPEDMVSLRLWLDKNRIISTRKRKLLSVTDLCDALDKGQGPRNSGDFLEEISDRLTSRMSETIEAVEDNVAELEDAVLTVESHELRPMLASLRRQTISLRRYLAPQREAIARLQNEKVSWLTDENRMRIREIYDRVTRYVEDLDAARDRASVTQEELVSRLSEQMDKRMYVLSLVAAIFLPLGFLTGLLGINIAGIPGAEYKFAFAVFCLMLIGVVIIQIILFKKKHWM